MVLYIVLYMVLLVSAGRHAFLNLIVTRIPQYDLLYIVY
jgi:hypothetical protein